MAEERKIIPRKSDDQKRTYRKIARLTKAESEQVELLMAQVPTTNFSEFLRMKLLNKKSKHEITDNSRLIFELNKAGNNFNQLVKSFNTIVKSGQSSLWLNAEHKEVIAKIVEIINGISIKK